MKELRGNYKSDFEEVKKYIEKNAAKGREREEAIESLKAIYFSAMEQGESIFEIHENSPKEYAQEICESLPEKKHINKKLMAAVFVVLTVALVLIAVIFGFKREEPSDIYEVSHQVFTQDIGAVIYSKEQGIKTAANFVNTSENKLWLSSDLWIERFDGENWVRVNADIENAGTIMVMPHESVVFCTGVEADRIFENIVPGDYRIVREIFVDEELSMSGGFAEHWFNIELSKKIIPAEKYKGLAIEGFGMSEVLPDYSNMPGEVVFEDQNQKEYCENIIDEIQPETVEGFYIVFVPSDETTYGEIKYNDMVKMLDILKNMEFTPCEPKNPNTGGGTDIYIETTAGKIIIGNNGGFITVFKENDAKAYAFDSDTSGKWFDEIEGMALDIIKENAEKTDYAPDNEESGSKEILEAKPISTDSYFKIQANLYRNSDKTYIPSENTEKILGFFENYGWTKAQEKADLGNLLTEIDTLELVRERDGKKYTLTLYENGFVLNGSAVKEEFVKSEWFCYGGEWDELIKTIDEESVKASERFSYWLGLINIKNVNVVLVENMKKAGNDFEYAENYSFTQEDEGMAEFISRLRDTKIVSFEKITNTERNNILNDNDKYVHALILFENGTSYDIYFTETEVMIFSSGVTYGLRHISSNRIDPYDDFLDFASGGPINAVTGTG